MDNILPQDSTSLKHCPICPEDNNWHPATSEFFFRNKKSSDGFNTPCKRCQKEGRKHPVDICPEGHKRCTGCKEIKPLEDSLHLMNVLQLNDQQPQNNWVEDQNARHARLDAAGNIGRRLDAISETRIVKNTTTIHKQQGEVNIGGIMVFLLKSTRLSLKSRMGYVISVITLKQQL